MVWLALTTICIVGRIVDRAVILYPAGYRQQGVDNFDELVRFCRPGQVVNGWVHRVVPGFWLHLVSPLWLPAVLHPCPFALEITSKYATLGKI